MPETKQKAQNSRFIVLSDAVVVTTGKKPDGKRPEYARVLRGGVINGSPESEAIQNLLSLEAIREVHNREEYETLRDELLREGEVSPDGGRVYRSRNRQTVRDIYLMGRRNDPSVAPQVRAIEPLPAPADGIDNLTVPTEGAILASSVNGSDE